MSIPDGDIANKKKSGLDFGLLSLTYKFRDLRLPRINVLKEVGIQPGFHVLDYGCGPGSYIMPLAGLVGTHGKIYALDINPLAIQAVQRLAAKKGLMNVQTILSGCQTELPSNSVNVVLLYDIIHNLDEPNEILAELHRVLKLKGVLSVTDHHLQEADIISLVTSKGSFKLTAKGKRTYSFSKEK